MGRKYRYVSINPDLESEFGHFLHQDLRVREVVESRGGDFISLAAKKLDARQEDAKFLPLFTHRSWFGLTKKVVHEAFKEELSHAVGTIVDEDPDTITVFAMYLGALQHIVPVLEIAAAVSTSALRVRAEPLSRSLGVVSQPPRGRRERAGVAGRTWAVRVTSGQGQRPPLWRLQSTATGTCLLIECPDSGCGRCSIRSTLTRKTARARSRTTAKRLRRVDLYSSTIPAIFSSRRVRISSSS